MKTLKVKSLLFSLVAVLAIAIVMTSCEQTNDIITEDAIENVAPRLDQLVNETGEPLPASMEQMTTEVINDGEIESRDACAHLESYGCPVYLNCAYYTYYNAYVAWFYNPTSVNYVSMQVAYTDYLLAHDFCN